VISPLYHYEPSVTRWIAIWGVLIRGEKKGQSFHFYPCLLSRSSSKLIDETILRDGKITKPVFDNG